MKTFTSTNDYIRLPIEIRNYLDKALGGEKGQFDVLLGGDVGLVEELTDLQEITVDYINGGTAADTVCQIDAVKPVGNYVMFFTATNDAGGPSYFIPKWMVNNSPILQGIIENTHAA